MVRVQLTPSQKDEIRRLTQFANRRIKAAQKVYDKAGKATLPKDLAGPVQMKEQWATRTTPLSRSTVFESQADYAKHIRFLRSFRNQAPTLKEYTKAQAQKTILGVETSMSGGLPESVKERLANLTAPELSDFWNTFSKKAIRMGGAYSSLSVLAQTLEEFFPEDFSNLLQSSL